MKELLKVNRWWLKNLVGVFLEKVKVKIKLFLHALWRCME